MSLASRHCTHRIYLYVFEQSLFQLISGAFSLHVLIQMLLILTKSVNRCFEKNPKFDMSPLLGGTDAVFSSLIHAFSWSEHFHLIVLISTFNHLYPGSIF